MKSWFVACSWPLATMLPSITIYADFEHVQVCLWDKFQKMGICGLNDGCAYNFIAFAQLFSAGLVLIFHQQFEVGQFKCVGILQVSNSDAESV